MNRLFKATISLFLTMNMASAAFGPTVGFWSSGAASCSESVTTNKNMRTTGGSWASGADTIDTLPANTTGKICWDLNDADHGGGANTNFFMGGFSYETDSPSATFSTIRFAIYVRQNDLRVYEYGTEKSTGTAFTDGDTACVERDGSTGGIIYTKNGVTYYTSATTSTAELKGDFAGLQVNDRALNIEMDIGCGVYTPQMDNLVNMTVYP